MNGLQEWELKITPKAEKELVKLLKDGVLNEDDRIVIRTWAETIITLGPDAVRDPESVWKDHELKGEWAGRRASSFSDRGRLIYRIEEKVVRVVVVKITPTHDYRKDRK